MRVWGDNEVGKRERKNDKEMNLMDEVKGWLRDSERLPDKEKGCNQKDDEGADKESDEEKDGRINVNNEEEQRKKVGIPSVEKLMEGELSFEDIKKIGTLHNVKYDGNCGYNSLILALKDIGKTCRDTVKEIRRDIRSFVENHKGMFMIAKNDLDDVFLEKYKYTGRTKKWMDGGLAGPVAAALFGVTVYIYLTGKEGKPEDKTTCVYHERGGCYY